MHLSRRQQLHQQKASAVTSGGQLLANKRHSKEQSPTKAAILIQKCVRGYLTRKKVKAFHYQVDPRMPAGKQESQKQGGRQQLQFLATRMQLYQGSEERLPSKSAVPVHPTSKNAKVHSSRIPVPVLT